MVLAELGEGAARTYRFAVAFKRGGDDNALAGAAARADFEWRDRCTPEPAAPALVLGDVRVAIEPGPYRFSRRSGTAGVGVRCLEAHDGRCRGRLALERRTPGAGRGIAMAAGRIDLRAGTRTTIALKLNRRAAHRIAASGALPVRAYVTARDAQGRTLRVSYRDRLVYPARGRARAPRSRRR